MFFTRKPVRPRVQLLLANEVRDAASLGTSEFADMIHLKSPVLIKGAVQVFAPVCALQLSCGWAG